MGQSCFYSLLGENDIYTYCKRNGNKIENCYCVTKMVSFYCFTQKKIPASSGILRKSLIASRSFESSENSPKYGFSLLECCCWMPMRRQRSTGRGNCAQLPKTEIVVIGFILLPTGEPESRDLQNCHFLKSAPTVGRSRPSKFLSSQAEKLP